MFLTLGLLHGCSAGGDAETTGKVAGKFSLDRDELISLKKANKDPKAFKKALAQKKIEQLREQGVDVRVTPSGRTKKSG